jgi:hypothetical protein
VTAASREFNIAALIACMSALFPGRSRGCCGGGATAPAGGCIIVAPGLRISNFLSGCLGEICGTNLRSDDQQGEGM